MCALTNLKILPLEFTESPHCGYHSASGAVEAFVVKETQIGTFRWERCKKCGLIYQNPCLTPESIFNLYSSDVYTKNSNKKKTRNAIGYADYDQDEPIRLRFARRKLEAFRRMHAGRFDRMESLLEIGPGTGAFLEEARKIFPRVKGIDASKVFVEKARGMYGLDIIHGLLEEHDFGNERFDVICLWGSISNLFDPLRLLVKAKQLLKPGGILWFNYISADCWLAKLQGKDFWLYTPSVSFLYTPASLRRFLTSAGFGITTHRTDVQTVSLTKIFSQTKLPLLWRVANLSFSKRIAVTIPAFGVYEVMATVVDDTR